jgi:hypothetical protein
LNKSTADNLLQRKLFIVGAVSFNFSEQLIVFLDVATSTQKTSHNFAARNKQKGGGKAEKRGRIPG